MRRVAVLTALLLGVASTAATARERAAIGRRGPRGAIADAATLDRAAGMLTASDCRSRVLDELSTGFGDGRGCDAERRLIGRALVRREGIRFGFVERRDVELWAVDLVLGEAVRCREWPVRGKGRAVLDPRDVEAAGCRKRRHEGAVAVTLVGDDGRRVGLPALGSDRDGRVRVVVAEIDAAARFAGLGGLRRWRWIELGQDGWAGRIDLARLHGFLADWHLRWVSQGRGAPGLFAVAHPGHAGADDARALGVEARLAREREDVEAVRAGRLSPLRFLARHPGSPFRREVEAIGQHARTRG